MATRRHRASTTGIRFAPGLVGKITKHLNWMVRRSRGYVSLNRSDAIRDLILRGIEACESQEPDYNEDP